MRRLRLWHIALPFLSMVCTLATLVVTSPAESARKPTRAEFHALTVALSQDQDVPITPSSVSISTVARGWASVAWDPKPIGFLAFHKKGSRWIPVGDLIASSESFDSECAYIPTAVVADLFHIRCPPYRALHARAAPLALRKAITTSLLADPTIRQSDGNDPSRVRVFSACVSRLDPLWASATVDFPDTGLTAWFHWSGIRWRVFFSWFNPLPPRAIILSLASCTGYNAAELGA